MAGQLNFTTDREEWLVSKPPLASDILWSDFTRDRSFSQFRTLLGYGLVGGVYVGGRQQGHPGIWLGKWPHCGTIEP